MFAFHFSVFLLFNSSPIQNYCSNEDLLTNRLKRQAKKEKAQSLTIHQHLVCVFEMIRYIFSFFGVEFFPICVGLVFNIQTNSKQWEPEMEQELRKSHLQTFWMGIEERARKSRAVISNHTKTVVCHIEWHAISTQFVIVIVIGQRWLMMVSWGLKEKWKRRERQNQREIKKKRKKNWKISLKATKRT